jgi:sec-independent protein translocase protein TatA
MGLDNPLHIAFLVVILLLIFGARRLPEMGKSLGEGMRGFKDAITGADEHQGLGAAPPAAPTVSQQQAAPVAAQPAPAPAPPAPPAPPAQA